MPKRSAILDRKLKKEFLEIMPIEPDEISEHGLWMKAQRLGLGSIKTMRRWLGEFEQLGKVKSTEKGPYRRGHVPRLRLWQRHRDRERTEKPFGAWPLVQYDKEKLLKTLKTLTPYGIGSGGDLRIPLAEHQYQDPIIFCNVPLHEMPEEFLEAWRDPDSARSWDFAYLLLDAWEKHLKKKRSPDEVSAIEFYENTLNEYLELKERKEAQDEGASNLKYPPLDADELKRFEELGSQRRKAEPVYQAYQKDVHATEPHFLMLSFPAEVYQWMLQKPFKEGMKESEWELRQILRSADADDIPAFRAYKTELRKTIKECDKGQYDMPSPTLLSVSGHWVPKQLAEFYRMQLSVISEFLEKQGRSKLRAVATPH